MIILIDIYILALLFHDISARCCNDTAIVKYCQAPGPVPGPGQCPGQGPVSSPWSRFRSELKSSKFSVKFSKERTWRDTIIKQTTPPHPTSKLFEALTIAYMMLVRSSTLTTTVQV